MNKTKTLASGCWYAIRYRVIPFAGRYAIELLTFLYFIFILAVSGGVDVWLLDDPRAVYLILFGTGIWFAGLATVVFIKGFWTVHTE